MSRTAARLLLVSVVLAVASGHRVCAVVPLAARRLVDVIRESLSEL
jgi:hypothetical protein